MDRNRTSLVVLDVLLKHELLSVIGHIWKSLLQVGVKPFQVLREFTKHDVKGLPLEFHLARSFCLDASNSEQEFRVGLFENSCVQDVELFLHCLLRNEECLGQLKILLRHISREVSGDPTVVWVVELRVWSVILVNLSVNLTSPICERVINQ